MTTKKYKQQLLDTLYEPYKECSICPIDNLGGAKVIFGEGNPDAKLMFIGEAPGKEEDVQGRPFVGRSGKLLNRILELADTKREDVFITNIIKCRPPNNRRPLPEEIKASTEALLFKQIKIIKPKVICTLGACALEGLLGYPVSISKVRGKPLKFQDCILLPTYHPAYILRNPKELTTLAEDIIKACHLAQ